MKYQRVMTQRALKGVELNVGGIPLCLKKIERCRIFQKLKNNVSICDYHSFLYKRLRN